MELLWPKWSSKILAGNAVLMAVFVIIVEKRIITPRYENHGFAGKSKTNFKNYSDSIMIFCSRTHNYVGDNSNDCLDILIDEIITDLPNLFKINDHKVIKINVKSLTVNVTVENNSVSFEIDTGASVTVFSESFYLGKFKSSKLLPYDVTLSSYTNQ